MDKLQERLEESWRAVDQMRADEDARLKRELVDAWSEPEGDNVKRLRRELVRRLRERAMRSRLSNLDDPLSEAAADEIELLSGMQP